MNKEQIEQAAMEIGKNNERCYLKYDGETETTSYEECRDSSLEMAKWLLSHQWISVEDELPKNYERVLILYEHGIPRVGYCVYQYHQINWYLDYNDNPIVLVSHWALIPEFDKTKN